MFTGRLFHSTSPEADPARRISVMSRLAPDSAQVAELLAKDPVPAVRIAAANRCSNVDVLASAFTADADVDVRAALAARVATLLSESTDDSQAVGYLAASWCSDAIRAEVARRTGYAERRRAAIVSIAEEATLVELALTADIADTRLA